MFVEITDVCCDVFRKIEFAVLSDDASDIGLTYSFDYLFRLTRTSINSEPVWKTLEFAV